MKNLIIVCISLIAISCSKDYEEYIPEPEPQDFDLNCYLDAAIKSAYDTHLWMAEEGSCEEYDCCWEYIDTTLRIKYENGERLSTEEKEAIIEGLEKSPSYLDTLDEYDEFYNLYCYKHYGPEYFIPWTDPDE